MAVLNRMLFRQLASCVGEANVAIANEGQEMSASYTLLASKHDGKNRYKMHVAISGEEYRINCPFCGDKRQRLSINHRWCQLDPVTKTRNMWLVQCWNEQCVSEFSRQKELFLMLKDAGKFKRIGLTKVGTKRSKPARIREIVAPGPAWSVLDIAVKNPRHRALQYLWDRLIDPRYVGQVFNVGFILESPLPLARNRLYAPAYMNGKLVGWQCRKVDESEPGVKWFTCPGMHTSEVLYNYDLARNYSTKVIVEGATGVWNFGQQAVAIFGKSMSHIQIGLLKEITADGDVIALMLDPDLPPDHKPGKAHHLDKVYEELNADPVLKGRVVPIWLPKGADPGMMDRMYMRKLITLEARKRGLLAKFKRKINVGEELVTA